MSDWIKYKELGNKEFQKENFDKAIEHYNKGLGK